MESPIGSRRVLASLLLVSPGLLFSAYLAARRAAVALLYKAAMLPEQQVLRDIPYRPDSDNEKHRLDLFRPEGSNWPILIFVHGGGLACGDKCLRVGGADVYGNIGRFYASQGIGVAVINYRLQCYGSGVTWRDQVNDVAHAVAWIYSQIENYGGDRSRIFIGGHSAGAYLSARVALDPKPLAQFGLSPRILSGVVAVSGAAFDLADERTYELGHRLCRYEARFGCGDPTDNWKREASPINCVASGAPPFLILYASDESKSLQRQSQLLHEALERNQVPSQLVIVPGQNHCRIVLTLSRPDKISAPAILRFVQSPPDPNL